MLKYPIEFFEFCDDVVASILQQEGPGFGLGRTVVPVAVWVPSGTLTSVQIILPPEKPLTSMVPIGVRQDHGPDTTRIHVNL